MDILERTSPPHRPRPAYRPSALETLRLRIQRHGRKLACLACLVLLAGGLSACNKASTNQPVPPEPGSDTSASVTKPPVLDSVPPEPVVPKLPVPDSVRSDSLEPELSQDSEPPVPEPPAPEPEPVAPKPKPLVSAMPSSSDALVCDQTVTDVASPGPKGYRLRGDRCEGIYTREPVSGFFKPVSFIIGSFSFVSDKEVKLNVSAPDGVADVRVRAVGLDKRYRLDARAPLSWPVAEVLYPERLDWRDIGVYGWLPRGHEKTYVPVRIVEAGKASAPSRDASVVLSVRPPVDVAGVFWRSARVENRACGTFSAWEERMNTKGTNEFALGELIPIDISDRDKGVLCIEVSSEDVRTGQKKTLTIRVLNPTLR